MKAGNVIEGRYRIIRQIGKGGGGIVYLAEHLTMRQMVILKEVIHDFSEIDADLFRTEVDILKRLKHPALPQVYDYLVVSGKVFTVMEYIPGHNLQEYINEGKRFSQQQIVLWARQLAEVLSYMHSQPQPVIHRDIKPSNIMLKPDGNICLIDFNISDDTSKRNSVLGYSQGFASPEQLEKGMLDMRRLPSEDIVIDERTDIYSLGAVLYYLLCGERPKENGKSLEEQNCCFYPLAVIVDKCLQRDKRKRYKTAGKLLHALNHLEETDRNYVRYTWFGRIALSVGIIFLVMGLVFLYSGYILNQKEAYYKAYDIYLTTVKNDMDNAEEKGLDILNNRRWKLFLKQNPEEEAEIFYELGAYFDRKEEYQNAMRYFAQSVETGEASGTCYKEYAEVCIIMGNTGKAERILSEAKETGLEETLLLFVEGELACAEQNYEEALMYFERADEKSTTQEQREEADSLQAKTYITLEQYEKARELLEAKTAHTYSDWMNLALIYQKEEKWEDAENVLKKTETLYPGRYMIYVRLALLEYEMESRKPQALKDYTQMKEYYEKAAELKKDETSEEWEQLSELMVSLRENGWI